MHRMFCRALLVAELVVAMGAAVPVVPAQQQQQQAEQVRDAGDVPGDARAPNRLQQLFADAVDALADPARRREARRRIATFGPAIVPEVCARLLRKQPRLDVEVECELLRVLGAFGATARPALPVLRAELRGNLAETTLAAANALQRVVPFLPPAECGALGSDLDHVLAKVRHDPEIEVLGHCVALGAQPDGADLLVALRGEGTAPTAACRYLTARPDVAGVRRAEIAAELRERLRRALEVRVLAFRPARSLVAAECAEALLAVTADPLDAAIARGLLSHPDPERRLYGLLGLADLGASLPLAERAEIAAMLGDEAADVVVAGCHTLARWGRAGLVALPPLHAVAMLHADASVRAAAATAAQALLANSAALPRTEAAWIVTYDALLAGFDAALPVLDPSPQRDRLLGECLCLVPLRREARVGQQLLQRLDSAAPGGEVVAAVYHWLATDDPELARAALAWLASHGAAVRALMRARNEEGFDAECLQLAQTLVCQPARNVAVEASVWFATTGADAVELRALLASGNTRLVVRALAALVFVPRAEIVPAAPQLDELTRLPKDTKLLLAHRAFDVYLATQVRLLAALVLTHGGFAVAGDAAGELAALVRSRCGVELEALPRWLAEQRDAGTLVAFVDAVEAECRPCFGVPPQLAWPSAGGCRTASTRGVR